MILTCELCHNQFLTESDPHVVIPGQEIKIYCYCQVKGNNEQKWIDQLKHEHKLYHKHLSVLNREIERLESENAKLNQEIEKFKSYLEAWGSNE
jgi:predicted RNase H-like nuclease (RuvC/YqgF family)